jgi:hypothetical protein
MFVRRYERLTLVGKRQREWAKRARLALIESLGGICVDCGCTELNDLQLDHIAPAGWNRESVDQSWRMSIYRREAKEGKLTVRCYSCNASKKDRNGSQARIPAIINVEHPF